MLRKSGVFLTILAISLLFSGCQPKETGSSSAVGGNSGVPSDAQSSAVQSSSQEAVSSSEAAAGPSSQAQSSQPGAPSQQPASPAQGAKAGSYRPREDLGIYSLTLNLGEEGAFTMDVSALMISGKVEGSYTVSGSDLTLTVDKAELPGFSAENVGQLHLTVQEDGTLYYLCDDFLKQAGIQAESITFEAAE